MSAAYPGTLTPPRMSLRSPGYSRQLLPSHHLEHQLHRHQHRIVAAHQPALGDAAEIIDQRDIELRLQRAVGAGRDACRP